MGGFVFTSTAGVNAVDVGISGLNAARIALQVAGHNIANVNTPGFSRQQAVQSTVDPAITSFGAIGRGTTITAITALRDRFLEVELAYETRELGRLDTADRILARIESIFNPLVGGSLNETVSNFFGAFHDLSANPESLAQREELLGFAGTLEKRFNETITRMHEMTVSTNEQIRSTVNEINTILAKIATLNVQVISGTASRRPVEDFVDQRQLLVRQLNEYIGVDYYEDEKGSLTILTGNGVPLLVQSQYAELSVQPNTLDPNRLDVISTFNSRPKNITTMIEGGRLGALVEQRDGMITDLMSQQRRFQVILVDAVNMQHRLGTDLNGVAGGDFFNDPFSVLDGSAAANISGITVVGDNALYEINYSVADNSTAADITDINISDPSALVRHDYRLVFGAGGTFDVYDQTTGDTTPVFSGVVPGGGGTVVFDGLSIDFNAQPGAGDTFELDFAGREGITGHQYRVEFAAAGAYSVYDITTMASTPVATGTITAPGDFALFDGLAVQFDAVPAAGEFFTIGYSELDISDALDAYAIAASDSAPGLPEPGNNGNAIALARLGETSLAGLDNRSFSLFQANEVSKIGTEAGNIQSLLQTQEIYIESLEQKRDSISGVSLDEEAAALMQYEQAYQANARYISKVDELLQFLINVLVQ
jgi:flagellar hook-associated protein 1 FlgK